MAKFSYNDKKKKKLNRKSNIINIVYYQNSIHGTQIIILHSHRASICVKSQYLFQIHIQTYIRI